MTIAVQQGGTKHDKQAAEKNRQNSRMERIYYYFLFICTILLFWSECMCVCVLWVLIPHECDRFFIIHFFPFVVYIQHSTCHQILIQYSCDASTSSLEINYILFSASGWSVLSLCAHYALPIFFFFKEFDVAVVVFAALCYCFMCVCMFACLHVHVCVCVRLFVWDYWV